MFSLEIPVKVINKMWYTTVIITGNRPLPVPRLIMVLAHPVLTTRIIGKIQEDVRSPVAMELYPRSIMAEITVKGIACHDPVTFLAPVHLAILMLVLATLDTMSMSPCLMTVAIVLLRLIAKAATVETTNVAPRVNVVMNNGGAGTQLALASRDADSEPTIKREPATVVILKPNRLISRTVILPSVQGAMYPAIGTIPAIVLATVIVVELNASIVRFLTLTARVVVQVPTKMWAAPVIMSTAGAGGITTMVKAKLLDVVVVVIIVIAPPPVVVGKMATITMVDTVTRTTEIPHCVANVPLFAIGMTQHLVPVPMVIVVVPNTKNARYLIRTRSADVPVPIRM
jgi:hypothetical protein